MRLFFILTVIVFFSGCEIAPLKRQYTEIFISAPENKGMPMDKHHAFLQNMPQDAIHANLINAGAGETGQGQMQMPLQSSPELEAPLDRSPLKWDTPAGWLERKGSGLRLVTFTSRDETTPVETTIISLGGQAGGLEANVARWAGQLGIDAGSIDMAAFLGSQESIITDSGFETVLVDLSSLQEDIPDEAPSMIAAVIDRGRSQVFVKMTGSKSAVRHHLNNFRLLLKSIEDK